MNKNLEYLILIVMIYVAIDLSSMVFAYKLIKIGSVVTAASSIIFPLTYSIMDITAEVYGYQVAKKIIWYGFVCDLIFAVTVLIITLIPSLTQSETLAYAQVLGSLLRAVIAQMIGVLSGAFINIYLISKWKVMTRGKYFWLRSIGSSIVGEGVMLIVSVLIALIGVLSFPQLMYLIMYTYLYKIFFAIAAAPFVSLIALIMKSKIDEKHLNSILLNPLNIPNNKGFSPNFQ